MKVQTMNRSAATEQLPERKSFSHAIETLLDSEKLSTSDLESEYRKIQISSDAEFELDESTLASLQKIADGMQEGLFIYRATSDETLLYADPETLRIFGCETEAEFRELTGNSFKGIVHPDEYDKVERSIFRQVNSNANDSDVVEYHIIRKDGSVGYVFDRGHCVHSKSLGNLFYVFISAAQTA